MQRPGRFARLAFPSSMRRHLSRSVLLSVSLFLPHSDSAAAPEPIKIGAFASLTGKEAAWGQSYEKGTRLAVDEINAAGGIFGRPIQLFVEDNQSKAGESATVARKLVSRDKVVAILGEVSSGRSLEAAPVCQAARIPMISSGSNPKVTEVGTYIFRVNYIDPFQGTVMAKFAKEKLGAKRVALLTDVTNAYSVGLAKYFREKIAADGGTIVLEQKYSASERDFKAQLTAIRSAAPDALFVPGYYTEVGLIAAQARELGFKAPILGGDGWAAPQLVELGGAALADTYYCDNFTVEINSAEAKAFITRYRARHKEDPDSISPLAYDAVGMLRDAITRAGSTEPEKIRAALATIKDLPGASGSITVDAQRNPAKTAYIVTYREGSYRFLEAIRP
jgi:branched-chain amino acid transport system substrate-binding protein